MSKTATYLTVLKTLLQEKNIEMQHEKHLLVFRTADQILKLQIAGEFFDFSRSYAETIMPLDLLVRAPEKIAALVFSQLKKNKKIFARKCIVQKIDKKTAEHFLQSYHLLNATQSAFNYGLVLNHELLAIASFSKGRKMNRLPEHQRSYEMIRFCSKSGVTVTGGLSKILKHVCIEKKAGDIMTYVDKQWSDGKTFIKAGFKKHSESKPQFFLIHRNSFERNPDDTSKTNNTHIYYRTQNAGNIKLVYTPGE